MSIEQRRFGQPVTQHSVHILVGVDDIARALLELALHVGQERELVEIVVALLLGGERIVDCAAVDAHRRTGLHAVGSEAQFA